jgi:hypothetical protein
VTLEDIISNWMYQNGTSKVKRKVYVQHTDEEFRNLRSQIVTSSWGGSRYKPMVFTEQGVAMLSSVLNRERAISVNIQIIRVFTRVRAMIESHKEILLWDRT